jgi:ATP-dependent Clp protease, protease subunit
MNPILKLLANNRGRGFFRSEANAEEATIYVYDVIVSDAYFGGVAAEAFVKELATITAPLIHLRINSPGGDVFAARAMEQALREHKSKVVAHIDGYAASAASFLAMAADEIEIAPGGFFMIHKAWTFALGNSEDLLQTAALLEKIDESLVKTYAERTGAEEQQIRDWLVAETWFTADEAVEHGFADRVATGEKKASAAWDMSAYQKAPKSESVTVTIGGEQPVAELTRIIDELSRGINTNTKNTDDLKRKLRLVATSA